MIPKKCEGCGRMASGYELLDYCAICSRDLCLKCMARGCCGHKPAQSGMGQDYGEGPDASQEESPGA